MTKPHNWFAVNAAAGTKSAEVLIYEEIGAFGVTAKDFKAELDKISGASEFDLRINSPGGNVFVGTAIYNMLRQTGAKITVYIDGVAASMASYIAMVGDVVRMPDNATMMIHNPAGLGLGESKDLRRMAGVLDMVKEGMVTAYADKSGLSREDVAAMMDEETWLSASDAVTAGFADEVTDAVKFAATFDLSKYKNPPEAPVAKGTQRGKSAQPKESEMNPDEIKKLVTDTVAATVTDAVTAAVKAALAADSKPTGKKAEPAPAESADDMAKRIKADIKAYNDEVTSLCGLAGLPDMAAEFLEKETPVADVRKALADAQAKGEKSNGRKSSAPNNHRGADGSESDKGHDDLVATSLDTDKIWSDYRKQDMRGHISHVGA